MEEDLTKFLQKQQELIALFASCPSMEAKYEKIIELGRKLPLYPSDKKTPDRIVPGCQSILYLHSHLINSKIYFKAESEALISAGLASLLLWVYSGETPEVVIKQPPRFLEQIGIASALSPGRSNGLASMYQRMQQDSLNFIVSSSKLS